VGSVDGYMPSRGSRFLGCLSGFIVFNAKGKFKYRIESYFFVLFLNVSNVIKQICYSYLISKYLRVRLLLKFQTNRIKCILE
jgi:hypothetical protein